MAFDMADEESDDESDGSSTTSSSASSTSSTDSSTTSSSSSSTTSSMSSASSLDTLDVLIEKVVHYGEDIFTTMVDDTIDFDADPLMIDDLTDLNAIEDFRFRKEDLREVVEILKPKFYDLVEHEGDILTCKFGYKVPYETCFLILLYRLSRPRRVRSDMERKFRMRKSRISAVCVTFLDAFYEIAIRYLSDPAIFQHRFGYYASLIEQKTGFLVDRVWGFIDGKLLKTCRPSRFQRLAYSGHKRCHGVKFQNVTTPDGLIALMFGPIPGSRHDSFMLAVSGLLEQLQALMPEGVQLIYSLYGDPAYPQSAWLFGGFPNANPGSPEAAWNTELSRVRIGVEWAFALIANQFKYLNFKESMRIFQVHGVSKYYVVAAFLTNIRSCMYGNEISDYFGASCLSLQEYLDLVQ